MEEATRDQLFLSAQSLTDLYDPLSHTFDSTGGIPPANLITTIARIHQHPACPSRLDKDITEATRETVKNLAQSAIFDPLDHLYFSRRNSRSFAIPNLSKNLDTQSEMLSAMASSPATPASRWASTQLIKELAQHPFVTSSILPEENNELAFFWSLDTLEDLLDKEELKVAKAAFNLKKLGNIPSDDDPRRVYYRRNTLGQVLVGQALASATGMSQADAEKTLASAIEKIKARRQEILAAGTTQHTETISVLGNKARLLTGLCRSYSKTSEGATLEYLNSIGEEILTSFRKEDGSLLRIPNSDDSRSVSAFAYDYAVTIEALLEWYRLTWNPERLTEARELTTLFLDNFVNEDNFLVEISPEQSLFNFPIANTAMVFGPSTWGTGYGVLNRLKSLGFEHPKLDPVIEAISPNLQFSLGAFPVTQTDYMLAAFNNLEGQVLVLSSNQKTNKDLRMKLAEASFDSVFAIVEDPALATLPSVGSNAAVLLKNGEVVQTFSNAGGILTGVRSALKK